MSFDKDFDEFWDAVPEGGEVELKFFNQDGSERTRERFVKISQPDWYEKLSDADSNSE